MEISRNVALPVPVTYQPAMMSSVRDVGLRQADFNKALVHRRNNSNNYLNEQRVGICVPLDYFKPYGPGTYLFFVLAKRLAILFVILFLISIPALVFNIVGKGLSVTGGGSSKTALMQFSIANQPVRNAGQLESDFKSRIERSRWGIIIPDVVYSIVFFVFVLHWEWSSKRMVKKLKTEYQLPSYYTLEVDKLPPFVTGYNVAQFMMKFGDVIEVSEVRNYEESIRLSKKLYENQGDILEERLKGFAYTRELHALDRQKINLFQKLMMELSYAQPILLSCFVTFKFPVQRDATLKAFRRQRRKTQPCCRKPVDPNYVFIDRVPRVRACKVEPSSLIWQNMHITCCSRFWRILLQTFVVILLVLIAVVLILILNLLVPQLTTISVNTSVYSETDIRTQNNETLTQTWCLNKSPGEAYADSIKDLCSVYYNRYFAGIGISIAIAIAIVIMTYFLVWVIRLLSRFQRYRSYNQQVRSSIYSLFFATILTTIVITILLQARIFNGSFPGLIQRIFKSGYIHDNASKMRTYDDTIRQWYLDIGYKIVINWFILTVIPYIFNPFLDCLYKKYQEWRARKMKLQVHMDRELIKPEFRFEEHYANLLTVVFVTLLFAGPMPILLLIAAIALTIRYIYWKYLFLYHSRIPRAFDDTLNKSVTGLLPHAIFFHMLMSMWTYGVTDIFPYESSITTAAMNSANNVANNSVQLIGRIAKRMATGWLIGIILLLLNVIYIFKVCIVGCYKRINRKMGRGHDKLPTVLLHNNPSFVQKRQKDFLSSYRVELNPDYSEILTIMAAVRVKHRLPSQMEPETIPTTFMMAAPPTSLDDFNRVQSGITTSSYLHQPQLVMTR